MYKCFKCNKEFKYESKLNEHKNRKTECNKIKKEYKCNLCNVKFISPAQQKIHEKTKKHIHNITINNDHGQMQIGDHNSINNIINLTLNVNSFKDTDMSYINRGLINDIGDYMFLKTIENNNLTIIDKTLILFDEIIRLLENLHFNIGVEENHNLKILLIFPGIKKKVFEYLILEINAETKNIVWKSLKYEDLITCLLDNLLILNKRFQNENYNKFIEYLKNNLIINDENSKELKPLIDKKLSDMYINFNKKQKKEDREVKSDITEKLHEYLNYRKDECKLSNGYSPDILESNIN
jgi:hypothetical protein